MGGGLGRARRGTFGQRLARVPLADYADALAAVLDDVGLGPAQVCRLSCDGRVVLER
jgi:hypothetical protein